MKQGSRLVALITALLLLCTGCTLDVEYFLQPPRGEGAQQAVQAALETYIRDIGGAAARYVLKYPMEGDHTAAFYLCDENGFHTEEESEARTAVAFYALATSPDTVHINLLRRESGQWVSVADAVGAGVAVRQVAFGDLNGDGTAEIVTGWTTYNNRAHQLTVYATDGGLRSLDGVRLYTALYVGNLTATERDSLLLLNIGAAETVTATLNELENDTLTAVDTVRLDGTVEQFGRMTLCRLAEGVHGLFAEGYKSTGETVTELICYDRGGLRAPFYDEQTNRTAVTTRTGQLTARDIDGDAMVEVPYSRLLPEHTANQVGGTVTVWRAFDYATGDWVDRAHTLMNTEDGYFVMLDEEQLSTLDTAYDTATRTLDLTNRQTGQTWLRLSVGEEPESIPHEGLRQLTVFAADERSPGCTAWYDPAVLRAEKVRYMVSRLTGQGG